MIYNLQALRFFAALYVVLLHYRTLLLGPNAPDFLELILKNGLIGVDIFFVLAGFIMVNSTGEGTSPWHFLVRRFWRIYSGYWPIFLIFLGFYYFFSKIPAGKNLLYSFFLYNERTTLLLIAPTWTLSYELVFYALFFVTLFFPRKYIAPIFTFYLVAGCSYLYFGEVRIHMQTRFIAFVLGIYIGLLFEGREFSKSHAYLALLASLGLFLFSLSIPIEPPLIFKNLVSAFVSAFLLFGMVALERQGWVVRNRFIIFFGNASYALYLWHVPIKIMYLQTIPKHISFLSYRSALTPYAIILLAFSVSAVYYQYVEKPLYHFIKRYAANMYRSRTAGKNNPDQVA